MLEDLEQQQAKLKAYVYHHGRRDIHVHIGVIDPATEGKIREDRHLLKESLGRRVTFTDGANIDALKRRIADQQLAHVYLYGDDPIEMAETVLALKDEKVAGAAVEIVPVFWVRDWRIPNVPYWAGAIKIHPQKRQEIANATNMRHVMELAEARQLPVLIHTEDEQDYLSNGAVMLELANAYPKVRVVGLHGGAYGPAPLIEDEAYCQKTGQLVQAMIDAVLQAEHRNLWLGTSSLVIPEKVQAIANALKNPQYGKTLAERMVMGSDYPILEETPYQYSNRFGYDDVIPNGAHGEPQEAALLQAGVQADQIIQMYENVRTMAPGLTAAALTQLSQDASLWTAEARAANDDQVQKSREWATMSADDRRAASAGRGAS